MFMNRALQLSVVKKSNNKTVADATPECKHVDHVDEYAQIAMYHAEHLVKIAGTALVSWKILDTACKIAVITAQAKIK